MINSKLNGESKNIIQDNVSKLKEIFPEIVTEDKIDFDKLKLILGKNVDDDSEKYSFTWPGKNQSIKESQKTSSGTLRPCKEESKNWDSTENLYIEGDNLEVLKLLQKSYYGKIKLIYIDPPYNTGKDFIYSDNYKDNLENYLKLTGQIVEEGERESIGIKLSTNTETAGRYHSNWLNMMYPRLKLARNLLSKDGVIFISIDENELDNLKKICNEIFGEICFIGTIVRKRRQSQANLSKNISPIHEYILIYGKNEGELLNRAPANIDESKYKNPDNDKRGVYVTMPCTNKGGSRYKIKTPTGRIIDEEWRFKEETYWNLFNDNRIVFPKGGNGKPRYKLFLEEKKKQGVLPNTWFDNLSSNQEASKEIKSLFNDKLIFDTPKPVELIKYLINLGSNANDIILDFFAGSSTTAEAIFKSNSKEYSNKKFILVQIPESTNEKSIAYNEGHTNICEIGKERIRRAGDKILEESDNKDLDIGFKVFKLDSSNLEKWDPDYDNLEQTLLTNKENIKPDRTELDLIYEIMLKYGIDLTLPIEKLNNIYSIGYGALLICLEDNITKEIAEEIIKLKSDDISRIVFKESGFKSDADKTNIKENLRINNIDEFITI